MSEQHNESRAKNERRRVDKCVQELCDERERLKNKFPICSMLIDEAIDRVYETGRPPGTELYADVYNQNPIKLTQKIFLPVKEYPKFNFSGKILGPKGNSLRRLQDETLCHFAIKGRNSMRDQVKEEELRNSRNKRYNHLKKATYVEISTVATPAEGYRRVAIALDKIRQFIVPDKNDKVSREQKRELMEIYPNLVKQFDCRLLRQKSVFDEQFASFSKHNFSAQNKQLCEEMKKVEQNDGKHLDVTNVDKRSILRDGIENAQRRAPRHHCPFICGTPAKKDLKRSWTDD